MKKYSRTEILTKLSQMKSFLRQEYSVKEIGLFGSFAEASNTDDSDIDILVELEKPLGWKFFTLEIYLEKTFNRKVWLLTKSVLKNQVTKDIDQVTFA